MEEENKNKKTIKGFEEENIEVSKFGEWVGKDYIDYKFEYENYQRILADSIPISVIQNRLDELDEQIKEFSTYVDESTGEEKQYWKRERAELVGARGALLGLLKIERNK